ncbi:UvrD-helicase domain-containing protein [Caniella muris]|uniref:UvrD-helicase domain-containing protein n=1 Tax=Caniella muris TaxID=2941502 RepID=UPI00203F2DDD|nr:UvrD-helicase domain-containing protein [Caniella muris]
MLDDPLLASAMAAFSESRPEAPRVSPAMPETPFEPTAEQVACVCAEGPATLVVAGAGCGKSTVIEMRISALAASGVDPSEVLCLSFTNAAADHLTSICPGIRSQTVASWCRERFEEAMPGVATCSGETFANLAGDIPALEGIAALSSAAEQGRHGSALEAVWEVARDPGSVRRALGSLGCCDLTGQAAFVAATQAGSEGTGISHVIVDEAQDDSAVDLLVVLSFCAAAKASLFMVGDACQSLYEFRDASPDTLAAMAGTGAFDVMTLTHNFRSAPEVLAVANAVLPMMASNTAGISLKAPDGAARGSATGLTFGWRGRACARKNLGDTLARAAAGVVGSVAAGGSGAVLVRTNSQAEACVEALREAFPDVAVDLLRAPRRAQPSCLSAWWARYRGVLSLTPPETWPRLVCHQVCRNLAELGVPAEERGEAQAAAAAWASWAGRLGLRGERDLMDSIRVFETSLPADDDDVRTDLAGRLWVSTVHGAKGLEFDGVVCLVDGARTSEEDLRLDYVALTRARRDLVAVVSEHTDRIGAATAPGTLGGAVLGGCGRVGDIPWQGRL